MANKNYVDKTGLLYVITKIKALLAKKVDVVAGKGLSTNDYTTEEKTKLSGIATGANNYSHPTTSGNKHVPSGGASGQILRWTADGTAIWGADNDTTYDVFKGAGASTAGGTGLVPAPAAGAQAKYLRGDGSWQSTPDTTYQPVTTTADGLMSVADKAKLDGIAAEANKTVVDSALSASSINPIQNKAVNTALAVKAPLASPVFTGAPKAPTAVAGTNSEQVATTAFVTAAVSTAVSDITGFGFEVVPTLPAIGVKGTIYLIANSGSGNNVYDEYIWVNNAFEKIGTTAVDLSGYMLTADLVAISSSEIDAMFA